MWLSQLPASPLQWVWTRSFQLKPGSRLQFWFGLGLLPLAPQPPASCCSSGHQCPGQRTAAVFCGGLEGKAQAGSLDLAAHSLAAVFFPGIQHKVHVLGSNLFHEHLVGAVEEEPATSCRLPEFLPPWGPTRLTSHVLLSLF